MAEVSLPVVPVPSIILRALGAATTISSTMAHRNMACSFILDCRLSPTMAQQAPIGIHQKTRQYQAHAYLEKVPYVLRFTCGFDSFKGYRFSRSKPSPKSF